MAIPTSKKYAYSTLVTRASYLPGVIILAQSLRKLGSQYPLIVFYTSTLSTPALRALELEAPNTNIIPRRCDPLLPPHAVNVAVERYADTWTKLRVFDLAGEYDMVCYVDADTSIMNKNMDLVFDEVQDLSGNWLAANALCVCNLDDDAWATENWKPENCAYTPLRHPEALSHPSPMDKDSKATYHLFNAGLFIYRPSSSLLEEILEAFSATSAEKLATYSFPDQDFLAEHFYLRIRPLGWQWNAYKTWRYWHPNIWRDEEVVCLHYIQDKPWTKRIGPDGKAGYKGNDGDTHRVWWNEYEEWERQRLGNGEGEVVELVRKFVAPPSEDA